MTSWPVRAPQSGSFLLFCIINIYLSCRAKIPVYFIIIILLCQKGQGYYFYTIDRSNGSFYQYYHYILFDHNKGCELLYIYFALLLVLLLIFVYHIATRLPETVLLYFSLIV